MVAQLCFTTSTTSHDLVDPSGITEHLDYIKGTLVDQRGCFFGVLMWLIVEYLLFSVFLLW